MLEIIILIFLTKKIGALADSKGLPAGRWKLYLVLGWIAGEILGVVVGMALFGYDNTFSWILIAIAFAVSSYFIIRGYLSKLPDVFNDDDINNIGQ